MQNFRLMIPISLSVKQDRANLITLKSLIYFVTAGLFIHFNRKGNILHWFHMKPE